ncbi:MAG TPA: 16S rRNA (guanine(966)-N(2))-methyltransferase RsmD [Terracidiphilus sp.]|nr:16S rRNA (guanine(966)-N(2))-methyltransferase RsmD [Terracidiphilus sp.]
MRIIAGLYRSRQLKAPAGLATRPTSDRLRETLFNVLSPRIAGSRVLDLYAGSGAVGLEALSRGAAAVTFVERARPALRVLKENLHQLGVEEHAGIYAGAAQAFLRSTEQGGFDIVFLDPPYDNGAEYESTLGLLADAAERWLAAGAVVVAEHRRKQGLAGRYGALRRTRLLEQGEAALSFFEEDEGRIPVAAIRSGGKERARSAQ